MIKIKEPKISIVMPSYNQAQYIERSILSVINQNYTNVQLIIIDGGSDDGTIKVINKYLDYVDYFVSEPDKGQSDALNKGFKIANGDIYGWLNSDDLYLEDVFYSAVRAFQNNDSKSIVFGDWLSINEKDNILDHHFAFNFNLNHFKYEGFHLNAQSMFWLKGVHERFSGFEVNLYNTMDYQMILEFGINEGYTSFLRVSQSFGAFRRYHGQKTAGMTDKVIKEHIYIAKKYHYEDKYTNFGIIKRVYFRFRRSFWYWRRGGFKELNKRLKMAYF